MPPLEPDVLGGIKRRDALKAMAASVAALMAGCQRPPEEIVPYVNMPERMVPGEVLRFATTASLAGYGRGVVALTHEGRPTKLEGNPRHPASLGSSDVFLEAAVLSLYDPDRSQTVRTGHLPIATWQGFEKALAERRRAWAASGGEGLRILTGRITSPTLLRQMKAFLARYPAARWHRYEPVNDDNAMAGSQAAFGSRLSIRPHLDAAKIIWTIGGDPLGAGPDQPRFDAGGMTPAAEQVFDILLSDPTYADEQWKDTR